MTGRNDIDYGDYSGGSSAPFEEDRRTREEDWPDSEPNGKEETKERLDEVKQLGGIK